MKPTLILSLILTTLLPLAAADSLVPGQPIELTGTHGRFDFIKVDANRSRLLASHTENGSLDVIDEKSSSLLKSIPTGNAQGVVVDDKNGLYYVSCSKPPKLVIVDATKLEVMGEVPLPDPADVLTYDATSNRVYVCNDEKPEIWVIDPVAKKIEATLTMPGAGMEDLAFNSKDALLFQALKDSNLLAKIDPAAGKVVASWPTAPVEKPHGIAMVPETESILVVGGNGKLVLMSPADGKIISSADVAPRVDEIAYDPGLKRVYCASGTGVISVVGVDQDKLTAMAPLPSQQGAHTIAVDPLTHTVWIAFAKDGKSYVQAFTLAKETTSIQVHQAHTINSSPVIVSKSKTPTLRSENIWLDPSTGKLSGVVYLSHGSGTPRLPHVHVYGLGAGGKILFSGCAELSDTSLHLQPRTNLNPRNAFAIKLPASFAQFTKIEVVTDTEDACDSH